ncbi:suppressor of fused domain protein [Nocardia sp. NPDC005366]|uniref:suppressor of fused domain protein n=1 Tax=Nocardia sp. NPDC005366 TaxID=3156878 RepID=UPI0033AEE98D
MSDRPGWDAIDRALAPLYPEIEPTRWSVAHRWSHGGPDPLDGVSAYPRTGPVPHWHYVGYGMTELYEKEWDDPDASGWGFEFTFRLVRAPQDTVAPEWPVTFMQNLARYVHQSGESLEPGHTIKASGPLDPELPDSAIRAAGFVVDPELGGVDSPFGRVSFLQIVGLTMPEFRTARGGKLLAMLAGLADRLPLYVTDIHRATLVPEPKPQATWPSWGGGLRGRA